MVKEINNQNSKKKLGGSDRAERIPLDYYKTLDPITRWKKIVGIVLLLATMGILIIGVNWTSALQGDFEPSSLTKWAVNHGEISQVHATWEHQCEKCHVPFSPIKDDNAFDYFLGSDGKKFLKNTNCTSCHRENLSHSKSFSVVADRRCASCHHEHKGKGFHLVDVSDQSCTECHSDLNQVRSQLTQTKSSEASTASSTQNSIFQFAEGKHPDFASLLDAGDTGTVKFNHQLHMAPGQGFKKEDSASSNSKQFQLRCSSCHQTSANLAEGEFVPVTYAKNCQGCHETRSVATLLTQRSGLSNFVDQRLKDDAQLKKKFGLLKETKIPHGMQTQQMHGWVRQSIAGMAIYNRLNLSSRVDKSVTNIPGQKNQQPTKETLPDFNSTTKNNGQFSNQNLNELNAEISHVMTQLLSAEEKSESCSKCHSYQVKNEKGDLELHQTLSLQTLFPKKTLEEKTEQITIASTGWKNRWLVKAKFHHQPHSRVACIACHTEAASNKPAAEQKYQTLQRGSGERTQDESRLMIPGIKNCVQCHSNSSTKEAAVSTSCSLCHSFHNSKYPLVNESPFEQKKVFSSIQDFIQGNSTSK